MTVSMIHTTRTALQALISDLYAINLEQVETESHAMAAEQLADVVDDFNGAREQLADVLDRLVAGDDVGDQYLAGAFQALSDAGDYLHALSTHLAPPQGDAA